MTRHRPLPHGRGSFRTVQPIGRCLCPAPASACSICTMALRPNARLSFVTRRSAAYRVWLVALFITVAPLLTACAPPASEGGLNSDNPASHLYAIRAAGERHDRAALPALVESLDSDDPAIRMMAISALERITGTRRGYDPYASAAQRQPAVEEWVKSVRTSGISPGISPGNPGIPAPATTVTPPSKPASAERS